MNTEHDELSQAEDPEEDNGGDESPESEDGPLTEPPEASHGFLEQFEALSLKSIEELRSVASLGLTPEERFMLMKVSLELFTISASGAKEEDFTPEMKSEIDSLLLNFTTLP